MLSNKSLLIASMGLIAPVLGGNIFTVSAYLPGSTLNGQIINADAEAFYLGLSAPSTYCPNTGSSACPNATSTLVAGMTAMWVEVPGGQQIYVNVNGIISYTQAHSESIPVGAYLSGFMNVNITSNCTPSVSALNWQAPNNSTHGVLACPSLPSYMNGTATYQIYARTPAFNQTNCVELDGLLPGYQAANDSSFGAWEYT